MSKWVCDKCGACCHVGGIGIPEFNRGDGVCIHLTKDNLCDIYETRPLICRTKPDVDYTKDCEALKRRFL